MTQRAMIEHALKNGMRVAVATMDQKTKLAQLKKWFPHAVFVLENGWYIRVVERKKHNAQLRREDQAR